MEFKIGDRVEITEQQDTHGKPGLKGKIIELPGGECGRGSYGVRFDKEMNGHSCDGLCEDNYGYNILERKLKLCNGGITFNMKPIIKLRTDN